MQGRIGCSVIEIYVHCIYSIQQLEIELLEQLTVSFFTKFPITCRHANIPPDHVTCTAHQLDPLLSLPSYTSTSSSLSATAAVAMTTNPCSTGEEINKKILDTFAELSHDLRHLRDLPLSINSLQGTSPAFRYTEV